MTHVMGTIAQQLERIEVSLDQPYGQERIGRNDINLHHKRHG